MTGYMPHSPPTGEVATTLVGKIYYFFVCPLCRPVTTPPGSLGSGGRQALSLSKSRELYDGDHWLVGGRCMIGTVVRLR